VRLWPLFLVLATASPLPGLAGAEPPARAPAPADRPEQRVYALRHAHAAEVVRVLQEVFRSPGERAPRLVISADERTNCVIVSAVPADQDRVEALINRIDTEGPPQANARILKVFQLKHRDTDTALQAALQLLFDGRRPGRFSVVGRQQVLVFADRETLAAVDTLLRELDAAPEEKAEPAGTDLEVRLFWVVGGSQREGAGKALEDFNEATGELGRLGIERPRLAARLAVSTVPAARFEMTGSASVETPCRVEVTGTIADGKEAARLDVSITVTRSLAGRDAGPLCRLRTQLTVPLDRPLVLGAAPAETLRSAFVVQVQRRTPAGPPRKAVKVEFRNAPWGKVLEWLSDQTGIPLISSVTPSGTFTFIPPVGDKSYSTPELIDTLNDALLGQNYLLVRRENSFGLVTADAPIEPAWVPRVRPADLERLGRTELVSLVVSLRSVPAEKVAPQVKKLLGPFGQVVVLKEANRLVLQDTAGNLRRVWGLLEDLDAGTR
jgi:hypothetical protein